jgi:hypothetical protein
VESHGHTTKITAELSLGVILRTIQASFLKLKDSATNLYNPWHPDCFHIAAYSYVLGWCVTWQPLRQESEHLSIESGLTVHIDLKTLTPKAHVTSNP